MGLILCTNPSINEETKVIITTITVTIAMVIIKTVAINKYYIGVHNLLDIVIKIMD